jgi:hypothetical protein
MESANAKKDKDRRGHHHEHGLDVSLYLHACDSYANLCDSATAVSVARFIIYYYRFSPTNTDRTYDIGVVVSIVEPSVGIMTACAPAMKALFRRILPQYFTENDSSYPERTRSVNTAPRQSLSYHFGMDKDPMEARKFANMERDDEMYDMRSLEGFESREQIVGMNAHAPSRTRSTKTGHSETQEVVPKHMLHKPE